MGAEMVNSARQGVDVSPDIAGYYRKRIQLQIQQYPGMPIFLATILRHLNRDDLDVAAISNQIRVDPGITANLLRLANSAKYGTVREINTVKEALVRLGLRRALNILVAFHMAGHLTKPLAGYGLEPREMLTHALFAATAAERLAGMIRMPQPEYVFTAALLHDVGKVLLNDYVRKEHSLILPLVQERGLPFDEAEQEVFGWSHAEVGAAILNHWNFPEMLIQAARHHHAPAKAKEEFRLLDSLVHLADYLSYTSGVGTGLDGLSYRFDPAVEQATGLAKEDIEAVVAHSFEQVNTLKEAFGL
jgi:putative nucleotidyltransferase with HDIG domain